MLPPQLRQSLVLAQRQSLTSLALRATSTHLLRAGLTTHPQRRSFFGWRRRSEDYSSHLDPLYHRFARFRTLKTRAKLLKNLRRRGKFNWDFDSKPFFTPQLVRWASHWDGKGRARWFVDQEVKKTTAAEEEAKKLEEKEGREVGEDGFELSPREKEWKEKMEAMRKRIEKDPYEAIFGKRFEPFWSPLVPSWMREEMGLQGWPKPKERESTKAAEPELTKTVKNETGKSKESHVPEMAKAASKAKEQQEGSTKMETATANPSIRPEQKSANQQIQTKPQSSSYSYASSTSWDSWTNKTKRVEWDSVSGQTRKYEYDPISNRMVQIEAPKPASAVTETKKIESTAETENKTTTRPSSTTTSIPVKQSSDLRKSIPIPPPLSHSSLGWSKMSVSAATASTSIGPWKSSVTAVTSDVPKNTALASDTPKPSALTKVQEERKEPSPEKKDIESLTAEKVRASMGKSKLSHISEAKTAAAAKTRMHNATGKSTEWDQAEMSVMLDKELESLQKKKEKLVKDERGLFHIERQKRELQKLDERIREVVSRVEKLGVAASAPKTREVEDKGTTATPQPALQSSVERMQSKELPRVVELDDSAAHESTEAISSALNAVPKNWAQQAELLQADRVRRTASKHPHPAASPATATKPTTPPTAKATPSTSAPPPTLITRPMNRWIDDMRARQSALEALRAKEAAAKESANAERNKKLERANAMLEAEVKETKFKMQAFENRYAQKVKGLRAELDVAYRQSAVHGEKHLERIRWLEEELRRVESAAYGPKEGWSKVMKDEKKVEEVNKRELEKLDKKLRDRRLVREVREIYEKAYGTIDAAHRQPMTAASQMEAEKMTEASVTPSPRAKQVVEVESDVDLGEALARYEKETPQAYVLPTKDLENEVARDEKAYYDNQGPLFSKDAKQPSFKLPSIPDPLEALKKEGVEESKKLVDDVVPKLIPTELTKPTAAESEAAVGTVGTKPAKDVQNGIAWEEPPVYKVLAYDSGNDMMSTATTTSNFTTSEAPISIPQALSQLYNPARFVPYFAELQKDGYQVIFGTTDLLVFKKVKMDGEKKVQTSMGLEDHGLYPPFEARGRLEKVVADEIGREMEMKKSLAVNPVDGTSKSSPLVETVTATGNFASPTGFVNHDPVVPSTSVSSESTQSRQPIGEEEDIEWRHYPRVRRMEQHFTGSRRRWNSSHRRHKRAEERSERGFHRGRKSTLRWITGVGAGTAAVMYLVGTVAQRSRVSREEDWARKAEEQRRRWRG